MRPGVGFHRAPGMGFHRTPGVAMRAHPFHTIIARHVPFARFTPAQRAVWTRGRWQHRWWHGRFGWWWYAGGAWFWYSAPIYPYPTVVSDYYYEEPESEAGPTWWYCYNPPGYYPYVPSCTTQWTPVPAQGYGQGYGEEQGGSEQGPPPGDAFPNHVFKGTVGSLSPGTGAQFAILPPQNATGNFVKVVQRVPVRIYFDANDRFVRKLKAGMSAYTSIDTGHRRSLTSMFGFSPAVAAKD